MRQHAQRGFTLIEIMIAAALAVTVVGGIILITNSASRQHSHASSETRAQTNTQAVTRMLTDDLRQAIPANSTGHTTSATCAYIATAEHWISYCNTGDGATRTEAPRSTPDPRGSNTPVPGDPTFITSSGGHVTLTLSGSQFLARIRPSDGTTERQLAITTRIGGN